MSSSASRPPEFSESADATPPKSAHRPSLVGPPKRPVKPVKPPTASPPTTPVAAPAPEPEPVTPPPPSAAVPDAAAVADEPTPTAEPVRQQPISPPSEPMQYRAIGLLRGRYVPTEEAFNRGQIIAQDETAIDAVLLGRVTSLVKKYLDMDANHLWVVYPRTNPEADNALNVQIVGVWEPETLMENKDDDSEVETDAETDAAAADAEASAVEAAAVAAEASDDADAAAPATESDMASGTGEADAADETKTAVPVDYVPADEIESDVFSIRGEVSRYHEEKGEILIGIQQKVKSGNRQQRTFKLLINGKIEAKTIGYFWDFEVRREGLDLVVHGGSCIAAVPPKKKSRKKFGGAKKRFNKGGARRPEGRRPEGDRRYEGSDAPKPRPVKAVSAAPVETPAPETASSDSPTE